MSIQSIERQIERVEKVMVDNVTNKTKTSDLQSNGSEMLPWVSPLESIQMFSIEELTQNNASPGDDSSGIFTAS